MIAIVADVHLHSKYSRVPVQTFPFPCSLCTRHGGGYTGQLFWFDKKI